VHEHPEAARFESADGPLQQQQVLEHAAGQRHDPEPAPRPQDCTGPRDRVRDPVVEPGRDDGRRDPATNVLGDRADEVRPDHPQLIAFLEAGRVAAQGRGGIGQLLKLDGRLPLVVDRVPNPEHRGGRVEQPPGARGQRRVDAAAGHGQHVVPAPRVAPPNVEEAGVPSG
jgi:hypothetical protein